MRPALNDKQIARMAYRIGLFQRRGLSAAEAEALADKLADRDHQRLDMHVCVECAQIQQDGACFEAGRQNAARRNAVQDGEKVQAIRPFAPFHPSPAELRTRLQRCDAFAFQTP